jgi:uncharacterized protein YutE (UPF0331/DUF86 family)
LVVEAGTVRRLLETIEHRLSRLEQAAGTPFEDYERDADLQDIVERNLEIRIQACIDLGLHVLADFPARLPETNRGVFKALHREELILPTWPSASKEWPVFGTFSPMDTRM